MYLIHACSTISNDVIVSDRLSLVQLSPCLFCHTVRFISVGERKVAKNSSIEFSNRIGGGRIGIFSQNFPNIKSFLVRKSRTIIKLQLGGRSLKKLEISNFLSGNGCAENFL